MSIDRHGRNRKPEDAGRFGLRSGFAAAFDTLKAARDLEAAGVEQHQAEAIAAAIRDGQGELATKADLAAGLAGFETRMVKFGFGLAVGTVAMNTALIVGLLRVFGGSGQ